MNYLWILMKWLALDKVVKRFHERIYWLKGMWCVLGEVLKEDMRTTDFG